MYLTTIDLTKYTTLGSADYPAYTLYDSLSEVIRHRLSPSVAAILAEPIFDDHSNEIDYSVTSEGEALRIDYLSSEDRNSILQKLSDYSNAIKGLAETYVKSDDPQAKRIGQNLRYAIYVPESADIYSVEGEPVLTGWGLKHRMGVAPFDTSQSRTLQINHEPVSNVQPQVTNLRSQTTPKPAAPRAVSYKDRSEGFPWRYLLLGLLALILLLLLLWWLFSGDKKPATNSGSTRNTVEDATGIVAKSSAKAEPESEPATTSMPPSTHTELADSGSDEGSGQKYPSETRPSENLPSTRDKLIDSSVHQTEVLVIPQSSIETGNMRFLFGDWISVTDLISTETREPLKIFYSFDESGVGSTTIDRSGRAPCTAPVKAEFREGSKLQIQDQADVRCSDGVYFPASSVVCNVGLDGQAVCMGEQVDNKYRVVLRRSVSNPKVFNSSSTETLLKAALDESKDGTRQVELPSDTLSIPVANFPSSLPAYERDYFGRGWGDDDGDCQNTRQEILISLSTSSVRFTNERGCTVLSGKWISPFTNEVHYTARDLDIDHQVPLKWAWDHGAYDWDAETRYRFANDPINLLPVEASLNRSKGALGLEWLPPKNQCAYIARFLRIMKMYNLHFFPVEGRQAAALIEQCKTQ